MFRFSDKPLAFNEIVKSGIEFYKDTFKEVWYLVLINMVLFAIIFSVLNYFVPAIPTMATSATTPVPTLSSMQIVTMWVCDILIFLVSAFFFSLIMHRMYTLGKGEMQATLKDSFNAVSKKYLILAAVIFLFFLAFIVASLALLIPGIVVGIFLAFCVPLVLFDNKKIFTAFKESALLVWGNWWRTFAVVFPVTIGLLLLNLLMQFLFGMVFRNLLFLSLVNAVVMTLFQSLVYAFLLVQFNDLKLRKVHVSTVEVKMP